MWVLCVIIGLVALGAVGYGALLWLFRMITKGWL